jgi:hypothetical protein
MKTSYFTKNNTLAQVVSVSNKKFHVYFNMDLEIIGVEPQWYDAAHNNDAATTLASVKVTEADIISFFKDARVYGHILEVSQGYQVISWDWTNIIGLFKTLDEARINLIDAIAEHDIDVLDYSKTSPFMEVLLDSPWGWISS